MITEDIMSERQYMVYPEARAAYKKTGGTFLSICRGSQFRDFFWSSSEQSDQIGNIRLVDFSYGYVISRSAYANFHFRCVQEDTGNTGDIGNTGNTGNTGDGGNSGDSGDSGDSGGDTGEECTSRYDTKCYNSDVWWYDSCGNIEILKEDCDNECSNGQCEEDNFPHSYAGIEWSGKSSNSMNWSVAKNYCGNLGGRLPTISELRKLVKNCLPTQTGGSCGVTDSCLSWSSCSDIACEGCPLDSSGKYSVFGDTYYLWSSSELSDVADFVLILLFETGTVTSSIKNGLIPVRCVK
jgi:hypothetical protein